MKKIIFYLLFITFLLLPAMAFPGDFEGPLHIKNLYPLSVAMGSPELLSATPENSMTAGLNYASVYMVHQSPAWYTGMDMETALLDLQLKKIVANNLEASIYIPVVSYNSGVLDSPMAAYHKAFRFSYGAKERPKNEFLFQITHNNNTVIQGENGGVALGDIRLGLKKVVWSGDPLISLQGFVNLPTGNADRGYGSGRVNGGAALLVNKALSGKVMAYFNAGFGLISRLAAEESVPLNNYFYGGAGVEWAFSEKWNLNAQLFAQQSPLRSTEYRRIDSLSTLLSLGGRYRVGKQSTMGISFTEDTSTAGAPDVTVALDYKYRF